MSTNAKKVFAIAVLGFCLESQAVQLTTSTSNDAGICNTLYEGELRQTHETSQALQYRWVDAREIVSVTTEIVAEQLIFHYCDDKTLRNETNHCLTWKSDEDAEFTWMRPCGENDWAYQTWAQKQVEGCKDDIGFDQTCVVLNNEDKDSCLGINGQLANDCTVSNMFRTKGQKLGTGRLQNAGTESCLAPLTVVDQVKVSSDACQQEEIQKFSLFDNGEIIHDMTGLCLGNQEEGNDLMQITYCHDSVNQAFTPVIKDDSTIVLQSKHDETTCMALNPTGEDLTVQPCDESDYQKWHFLDADQWAPLEYEWILVGCMNGHEISSAFSEKFTYDGESPIPQQIIDSALQAAQNNINFENYPPITDDAQQYLIETMIMMNQNSAEERQHVFSCDANDDGTPFLDGCMYRAVFSMDNWFFDKELEWVSPMVRCTSGAASICPPLTKCSDDGCNSCVKEEQD